MVVSPAEEHHVVYVVAWKMPTLQLYNFYSSFFLVSLGFCMFLYVQVGSWSWDEFRFLVCDEVANQRPLIMVVNNTTASCVLELFRIIHFHLHLQLHHRRLSYLPCFVFKNPTTTTSAMSCYQTYNYTHNYTHFCTSTATSTTWTQTKHLLFSLSCISSNAVIWPFFNGFNDDEFFFVLRRKWVYLVTILDYFYLIYACTDFLILQDQHCCLDLCF